MSVTHKKSKKQIGAAELEALRASIMAEVEAARAETEESIISSIRNNLVSLPEQGEEWNEKKSYITGDVVTLDGVSYTATHYSRGKSPASNPDKWTRTPTEEQIGAWADLPDGEVITEGTKVTHNGKKWVFKSITFDNGSEFMDCAGIEKSVYGKDRKRTKVYYCHPYSAYERGTNENINKMIRRFLPKGTDFRKVTAAYIQRVETWINNYPREILGFETSGSLFERYVAAAA